MTKKKNKEEVFITKCSKVLKVLCILVGVILLVIFLVEFLIVGLFMKIGVASLIMIFTTVFGLINLAIYVLLPLFFGTLSAAMFTEVLRLEKVNDIELWENKVF